MSEVIKFQHKNTPEVLRIYDNFEDVEHLPLQVYNRFVTSMNIEEDLGQEAVKEYLSQFTEGEKKAIYIMSLLINSKGKEVVHKIVTKELEINDEH